MGRFLRRFKETVEGGTRKVDDQVQKFANSPKNEFKGKYKNPNSEKVGNIVGDIEDDVTFGDHEPYYDDFDRGYDDVMVQPAQKPESFHHFILENQYKDLERSIRGLKDVWDKETQQWRTKKKDVHCFTDEEAEEILRTAQSHLATDIKLGRINSDVFGDLMNAIYKEIAFWFESVAEYRYGRYGEYDKQYDMKLQNQKIFLELWARIQANYSRAIAGAENIATHGSVKGQESLQSIDRDYTGKGLNSYN